MAASREPLSPAGRAFAALFGLLCASCSRDSAVHPTAVASAALEAPPALRETTVAASLDAAPIDSAPAAAVPPQEADKKPRIGSIGRTTWIYAAPKRKTRIGYLRPGTSVALAGPDPLPPEAPSTKRRIATTPRPRKSSAPTPRGGCKSGLWREILPTGYICEDETTTLDLETDLFRALAVAAPRSDKGALPFGYAFSMGAPMYGRVPGPKETRHSERRFIYVEGLAKLRRMTTGHEDLDSLDPIPPTDPLPSFLADGKDAPVPIGQRAGLVRKVIPHGSMLAFSRAFDGGGRTFLLTPELTLVPADRVRPFRASSFHGVTIGSDLPLPIGWFRKAPRPQFRRDPGGAMVDTGGTWQPRTYIGLTGKTVEQGGAVYYETRADSLFARANDLSVVSAPAELPSQVDEDDKWIEVSLSRGTLTLFVGRAAVYSTLMSPGAGGVTPKVSLSVEELIKAALTPLGTYRITVKHRAAQMTSEDHPDPEKFWIAEVPYTQYFRPPFAIHTAYWHEDFGLPKSGGCINLSPIDAAYVFGWTEPAVPEDWAGRNAVSGTPGTKIVITR